MSDPVAIMVAPNGARRTKSDHRAIPITVAETARCAAHCFEAGAQAIHAHVRDADGQHVLDAQMYRDLIDAVAREAGPEMIVQITTEAVGRYSPAEQDALVRDVRPQAVSVALREMIPDRSHERAAADFYGFCAREHIAVQHILYAPEEIAWLGHLQARSIVPTHPPGLLFVLGRYSAGQQSAPGDLVPFLTALGETRLGTTGFMVCAFGAGELPCLASAVAFGGHVRTGFENSLWRPDGSIRADNAESVTEIAQIADVLARPRATQEQALAILGG